MSCWPVVCAWRVCRLFLIVRRTAHGPTRHHLSACHLRCGVRSNAPSPELLRRDATRVHIILTNLRQRRCPVSWSLLVVTIPLNHHLGLFSFTCTRGWPIGVRAHITLLHVLPGLPLRRWRGVFPGRRVRRKLDVLPTSGSTVFYNRSAVLQPARHCPLDGRVH